MMTDLLESLTVTKNMSSSNINVNSFSSYMKMNSQFFQWIFRINKMQVFFIKETVFLVSNKCELRVLIKSITGLEMVNTTDNDLIRTIKIRLLLIFA